MKRTLTLLVALTTICSLSLNAQVTPTYTDPITKLEFQLVDSKAETGAKVAMIVPNDSYSTMTELVIPSSVMRLKSKSSFEEYRVVGINANAFKGIKSLKKVTLDENAMVQIGLSAFQDCSALEEVDLRIHWSSELSAGTVAKLIIDFVKEITVGETVFYELFPSVFAGCTSLKTVKLSGFHTKIGKNAFKDCASLESVNLEDLKSLTTFDDYAFAGCSSLENIFIGDKVSTFGKHVFEGCTSLSYVDWETALVGDFTSPEGTNPSPFYDLRDNESLEIENLSAMTRVPSYMCYGIKNLFGAVIAEEIGAHAFEGCTNMYVKTLTLNGVKKIEESAFNGPSYKQVRLPEVPPTIYDENVFGDIKNTAQFYIESSDCNAVDPYKADANWSKINVESKGGWKTPEVELVILDEYPTGTGTSRSVSRPIFTLIPTCENQSFRAEMGAEASARCSDAGGNVTVIPFGYYEYKGEKYYTNVVTLDMTNQTDVLKVVYTANVPEAVDNVKGNKDNSRKLIRDGQIFIQHNGKTYNLLGAEVE